MYKQLAALFARYAAAHLNARGKPQGIFNADGQMVGAIDVVSMSQGEIRVAGWTLAGTVVLHMNGIKATTKANLHRHDVAQAHGLNPDLGFDLVLPLGPVGLREISRFGVEFHDANDAAATISMPLPLMNIRYVQLRIIFRFVCALLAFLPACLGWLITRNSRYRAHIKQGLKLTALPQAQELDPDLFRLSLDLVKPQTGITIVMPVFNAFDLVQESLKRVVQHTDVAWRLILIEDCSSDPRVRPFLEDWKKQHPDTVILIKNDENLGFIHSVNRGFEKALLWGDPVILMNSDALVPAGWASRLIAPMMTEKDVATVTPMSNDAEIFTAPLICTPQPLAPRQGDEIDATAIRLNPCAERVFAPTGVGFCMAINLKYLNKISYLDTAFGRGYGEEVDWCQRARAFGGKHMCATNLFIEHRGGQSFGSAEKRKLISENNQKITKRYPAYDIEVQRFVSADPLRSTRLALALAWVGAQDAYPVSIYLAHSMGGGAEAYLQNRITKKHHALGRSAIILRVGGAKRWQIELVTPDGLVSGRTDDLSYVHKMLLPIARRRIIYSCGVGDHDPANLPDAILSLSEEGRHAIEVVFHDYFAVSPSYTLLDDQGRFDGIPEPTLTDNPAHQVKNRNETVTLDRWQEKWGALIEAAKDVVVFSSNSADIVVRAYPQASDKIALKPHKILQPVPRLIQKPAHARRVIGVLGDIGYQKGAGLIDGLARYLEANNIGLAIVGHFDLSFPLPPSVPVHGAYKISNLAQIAARYGITDWIIPSIWPETFSFTTHEALATGLPVHAFGLGAQGDAVTQAENGFTIPFASKDDLGQNLQQHFAQHLKHPKRAA